MFVTTREILEQLTTLGAVDQVAKQEREKALRTLAGKNLIARMTGKWGEMDSKLAFLPSIVCAISAEKTKAVVNMLSTWLETYQSQEYIVHRAKADRLREERQAAEAEMVRLEEEREQLNHRSEALETHMEKNWHMTRSLRITRLRTRCCCLRTPCWPSPAS